MIQLVTGACLLGQHDGCSGYTHDHFLTASEQPCLCPCHYDRAVRFQPNEDDEPRYDRAQPAGLQGALDARRLLLTLVLAALLYLALCALSSAASNAAAPILYP